ncbi:acyl-ACP--UDP-N-acetylglucosamine O-acyltransferase [Puniceicoccales bacterium CK1056]|uniref:Acyl-ACP--UDP-N-acetylglucosamine O-acyltransferase n=1 Tax=Oceanipulchritudo coccoides TaxID=2706888 RepID=A0A6B2LZN3_9BACT|nr:acyl-ACP--UDP-N-acetylglucosamine O-acyltransferase [Oceanipulchritudo coccoides]NDV62181.1 acyl-ACP--UDP-N-acetylglucosamine O-acyltransferase [Oceanipulchritudo coccoides]
MKQHPTAVIHEATRLDENIVVGPYAVIEDGVEIGEGTVIREHAIIRSGTILGKGCQVDAHAVIGGLPQDLSFNPKTPTGVRVGDGVTFREGVTVNRATAEGTFTEIGDRCLLMANSHVAHDCRLGANVIFGNGVLIAGKGTVGDYAFFGGNAGVHQNIRIGKFSMIGGVARVSQDMPPFCMMAERNELIGLNLIGLQRRGVERETIKELKKLYQLVFGVAGRPRVLAQGAIDDKLAQSPEALHFLEFLAAESIKGVMRPRRGSD